MSVDLKDRYLYYFELFNREDRLKRSGTISDDEAAEFLISRIPLVDLPDKMLEEVYAFRWWSFRKHLKKTPDGWVITEFLPDVPWAGRCNTINCAACFHIREARWLYDPDEIVPQYMDWWLDGLGDAYSYSMWLPTAIHEYCRIRGYQFLTPSRYEKMAAWFEERNRRAAHSSGLFQSIDDRDGMEYSASGSGLRPTINSYVCGDAFSMAEMAERMGNRKRAEEYFSFAVHLKEMIHQKLWRNQFYQTIPAEKRDPDGCPLRDTRELIGYIPWYFGLAEEEKEVAFDCLLSEDIFSAPFGLTTLDKSHPDYMKKYDHECLWNGPVWPYATSQVLTAAARMLRTTGNRKKCLFSSDDFFRLLHQYAGSHFLTEEQGKKVFWIDENMDPDTGRWLSRDILDSWGWPSQCGGFERGAYYNHSLFCDIILSGLLGIDFDKQGKLSIAPLVPSEWKSFRVENLRVDQKTFDILYDEGLIHVSDRCGDKAN